MSLIPPIVFAFTGTSLTTGRLSADWVPRLKNRLKQEPEAKGPVQIFNMGKGSQTSDWGVSNAPQLSYLRPTHILFEDFAINDCAIGPVTLGQAASNFDAMVNEWRSNIPGVDLTHQTMSPASSSDAFRTNLQTYYTQGLAKAAAAGIPSLNHTPSWPAITDANTNGASGFAYALPSGFSAWGGASFDLAAKGPNLTLSTGNHTGSVLDATFTSNVRGLTGQSAGKLYFEVRIDSNSTSNKNAVGIATSAASVSAYLGSSATAWAYYVDGSVFNNSFPVATYPAFSQDTTIMVAVNFSTLTIWFGRNGVWSGDPVAGTGGLSITAGTYFPAWGGAGDTVIPDTGTGHFNATFFGGDQLHPLWSGVFETYSYPSILAWAKARMATYWS